MESCEIALLPLLDGSQLQALDSGHMPLRGGFLVPAKRFLDINAAEQEPEAARNHNVGLSRSSSTVDMGMTPIQDLLHRIQWDAEFGNASFTLGYYDRVRERVFRVSFERVHRARGDHFSFDLEDADGRLRMIPFHRVREVWRNGVLIWERKPG